MIKTKVKTIKILSQLGIACSVFFFLGLTGVSTIYVTLTLYSLDFSSIPPFVPFPGWDYYFPLNLLYDIYIGTILSYITIAFSLLIFIFSITIGVLFQLIRKDPIFQTVDKEKMKLYSILIFFLTTFMLIPTLKLSKAILKKYEFPTESVGTSFADDEQRRKFVAQQSSIIFWLNFAIILIGMPSMALWFMLVVFIINHISYDIVLIVFFVFLVPTYILSFILAAFSINLANSKAIDEKDAKRLKTFGILYFFFTVIISMVAFGFTKQIRRTYDLSASENPTQNGVGVIEDGTLFISSKPISLFANKEENNIEKINKLYDLLQKGCITEEEYEKYKTIALEEEMNKFK